MGWKDCRAGPGTQEEGSLLIQAALDLESHNSGNCFHCCPKKGSHGPQWGGERKEHTPHLGKSGWDAFFRRGQ